MKLFYSPGSCSLATHIALRELGLPFTLEAVDLRTKRTENGADFIAISPKGCVPTLQLDDGEVLTEGAAILQFLADLYAPGALAPIAGTIERARHDGHLHFIAAELRRAFSPLFSPTLDPEAREAAMSDVGRKLDGLEKILSGGRTYLTGQDLTVADIYLFVMLSWAPMLGVYLLRWPSLRDLSWRIFERPAVQAAMAAEGMLKAA